MLWINYCLRQIWRYPHSFLSAGVVLGVVLGLHSVIHLSFIQNVRRPFDFDSRKEAVVLTGGMKSFSPKDASDLETFCKSLSIIAFFERQDGNVSMRGQAIRTTICQISPEFFTVCKPVLRAGRLMSKEAYVSVNEAIISESLARRITDQGSQAIGRVIRIKNEMFTVVGIVRDQDKFPRGTEAWIPIGLNERTSESYEDNRYTIIATRSSLSSLKLLNQELQHCQELVRSRLPERRLGYDSPKFEGLSDNFAKGLGGWMSIMYLSSLAVVVLAIVNVSLLWSSKLILSEGDRIVFFLLGTTRKQLLLPTAIECCILWCLVAVVACFTVAGIAEFVPSAARGDVAMASIHFLPNTFDRWAIPSASSVLAVLVLFVLLMLQIHGTERPAHRATNTKHTSNRKVRIAREFLIVAQIAIAFLIVACALLFRQNAANVQAIPLGFSWKDLILLRIKLDGPVFQEPRTTIDFQERLLTELEHQPETRRIGVTSHFPLTPDDRATLINLDGREMILSDPSSPPPYARVRSIAGSFFAILQISLRDGRFFTEHELTSGAKLAVVSEKAAATWWPNQTAIGRRIQPLKGSREWYEVIGISGDIRAKSYDGLVEPEVYIPVRSMPSTTFDIVFREGNKPLLSDTIRTMVARIDPEVAVQSIHVSELVQSSYGSVLAVSSVSQACAIISLLITGFGVLGAYSFWLMSQRSVIAIKLALGAQESKLIGDLMVQGLLHWILGCGAGLATIYFLSAAIKSQLFQSPSLDFQWFAFSAVVMLFGIGICIAGQWKRIRSIQPVEVIKAAS